MGRSRRRPPVLRSVWSSDLSEEKHGCHTRVTPDAGGDGGGGGSSGFSVRGLLRVMRRGRRGQSTQVVPLSRSNSLSGRLSRTASGLSRSMRGLLERSFRRGSPRSDPEGAYKPTDVDGDPSAPSPQRRRPRRAHCSRRRPRPSPSPPPSPPAPQPPIPPPSSAAASASSRPNGPRPPPVHTSEGELSDLADGVVEDFSGSVGDSLRSESCRSSFGDAAARAAPPLSRALSAAGEAGEHEQ